MWPKWWFVRLCCSKVSQEQFFWLSCCIFFLDGALQSNVSSLLILTKLFSSQTIQIVVQVFFLLLITNSPFFFSLHILILLCLDICLCMSGLTPVNAKWHSLSALLEFSAAVRAHQMEHTPGRVGKSKSQRTVMKYCKALCSSMNSINSQTNNCFHYQNSIQFTENQILKEVLRPQGGSGWCMKTLQKI